MIRRVVPALALSLALALGVGLDAERVEGDPDAKALAATRQGARELEGGRLARAVASFETALKHAPASPAGRKNLALALAREAEDDLARKDGAAALGRLERALELHPGRLRYEMLRGRALLLLGRGGDALRVAQDLTQRSRDYAAAWMLLGDVQERGGALDAALDALARVAELRPAHATLRKRIADLRRRAEAEAAFLTHGTGNFVVRYGPDVDGDLVRLALTLLEDAYSRVTADLGVSPRTPARVILYEGQEFQRVTGAHSWVGALYQKGVLRVPIRNLARHRATASRVLSHEFTHHVLKERVPHLPTWWHEGIAQHVEESDERSSRRLQETREVLSAQKARSRLLSLAEMRVLKISRVRNSGTVHLYYAQALSFVGWLVDRFGAGAMPSFLTALGTGTDIDAAAKRAFGSNVTALYKTWFDSL